ncbi:hypothetical protein KCP75_01380 [Salmonella enterica subsp. enterica]|nr:hypothetical protein KCP75_01380 [Salmonella enterica subsp. enterica]
MMAWLKRVNAAKLSPGKTVSFEAPKCVTPPDTECRDSTQSVLSGLDMLSFFR